jgi:protein-L-isoaspartate(D-aspartate) O-methyltransferase
MERVPRELFVPEDVRDLAYEDAALPLDCGQTISQPYIVALICQALALDGDERVLDVGTGSGYQAAVLAELAAEVYSIERIPELAERARETLARAGYERVHVHVGDGTLGLPEHAPYDGIAVAAAAPGVPPPLWDQLRDGGRIVLPLGEPRLQELRVIERAPEGPRLLASVPARFVPLLGEEGYDGRG